MCFLFLLNSCCLGLPKKIIPNFGEIGRVKIIHATTIANDFSPYLFYGIQLMLVVFILIAISKNSKVRALPLPIRNELEVGEL